MNDFSNAVLGLFGTWHCGMTVVMRMLEVFEMEISLC